MAVKKAPAKKKVDAPAPAVVEAPAPDSPLGQLDGALVALQGAAAHVTLIVQRGWDHSQPIPSDMLRVAKIFETVERLAKKTGELIDSLLKAHKAANGTYEPGAYTVVFSSTDKRSPKWKEEAVRLGRECFLLRQELAELRGEAFTEVWDEKVFCAQIVAKYPPSTGSSVKVLAQGETVQPESQSC